jgi:hypothetical protein
MKRDKVTYPIVKQIKPMLWKECRFCKREFKREIGYEILDYTAINPSLYFSYCCNDCGDNVESVKALIEKSKIWFPPRDRTYEYK